jgi:hypothetical protein
MASRRDFLTNAAGAVAGFYAFGAVPLAVAQVPRREVSIGGRRVTVVDIHGHCAIEAVEEVIRGTNVERSVSRNRLLGPHRLDLINERGIDVQVMSANQYWWYAADEKLAALKARGKKSYFIQPIKEVITDPLPVDEEQE